MVARMKQLFTYENIARFNGTDLMIYKYVTAHETEVSYMTVRELARQNHVSTSSILRFCEKLGCEGYSEFREALRAELRARKEHAVGSDIRELMDYFERTRTEAFGESIERAVKLIHSARQIVFMGIGGSGILARYGARYFSNYGKLSFSIEDPYYPILEDIGSDTLIIALSVSGESERLIAQLRACRERGFRILSVTNDASSTIALLADQNISYNLELRRSANDCNMTSQVPVMFLIEILAHRLDMPEAKKFVEKLSSR